MARAEDLLFNSLSSPKILLAVLALITVLKTCNPRQYLTHREQEDGFMRGGARIAEKIQEFY
jgi:hypothetical protein